VALEGGAGAVVVGVEVGGIGDIVVGVTRVVVGVDDAAVVGGGLDQLLVQV
jgi:hypothetical protein